MDKKAGIEQLFEIINMKAKVQQSIYQMFELIRQQGEGKDHEEFVAAMQESFDTDAVYYAYMAIWEKFYSIEDITGLIQFYQMPLGKKLLEAEPLIQQESELVLQQCIQASIEKLIADV